MMTSHYFLVSNIATNNIAENYVTSIVLHYRGTFGKHLKVNKQGATSREPMRSLYFFVIHSKLNVQG